MDYFEDDDDDELPDISIDCSGSSGCKETESVFSRRAADSIRALGMPVLQAGTGHSPDDLDYEEAAALVDAMADLAVPREPFAPGFLVLLEALHQQLPVTLRGFITAYLDVAAAADSQGARTLYREILSDIVSVVGCPTNTLSETEVVSASAWLLCACASMRVGVSAMQTMQHLLNERSSKNQITELCGCVQRCGWEADTLLRASEAARGGGRSLLADLLLRAAAAAALACQVKDVAPASVDEVTMWAQRGLCPGGASPAGEGATEDTGATEGAGGTTGAEATEGTAGAEATDGAGGTAGAEATEVAGGTTGVGGKAGAGAAEARLAAVRVAGRLLAHCTATDKQREALVAAFTRRSRVRGPHEHKVALAVSRLWVRFH